MDLGCYGLHIMRQLGARGLGRPAITAAHASQRGPGVDEWCDVDLSFPSGATGLCANSMTAAHFSFTINVVGTKGDALVHDFIRPHADDRITVRTPAETRVEHLGTRPSYAYQLEAFAAHILDGAPLPIGIDDAVQNMHYVDAAYRAAGMSPR